MMQMMNMDESVDENVSSMSEESDLSELMHVPMCLRVTLYVSSTLSVALTLSRLWTTYVVQLTDIFQKFTVLAVLELCARCRYQHMHMRIELLFHVVFSTSCFEVHFVQYCRKKSDRLMMTSRSS